MDRWSEPGPALFHKVLVCIHPKFRILLGSFGFCSSWLLCHWNFYIMKLENLSLTFCLSILPLSSRLRVAKHKMTRAYNVVLSTSWQRQQFFDGIEWAPLVCDCVTASDSEAQHDTGYTAETVAKYHDLRRGYFKSCSRKGSKWFIHDKERVSRYATCTYVKRMCDKAKSDNSSGIK